MKQSKTSWLAIAESFLELPPQLRSEQRLAEMMAGEHAKRTDRLVRRIRELEVAMAPLVEPGLIYSRPMDQLEGTWSHIVSLEHARKLLGRTQ